MQHSNKTVDDFVWKRVGSGACLSANDTVGHKKTVENVSANKCREACANWTKCAGYESSHRRADNLTCKLHVLKPVEANGNPELECFSKEKSSRRVAENVTAANATAANATAAPFYDIFAAANPSSINVCITFFFTFGASFLMP
jgi:hypothetical protein